MKIFLTLFLIVLICACHSVSSSLIHDVTDIIKEDWMVYRAKSLKGMNACTITETEACDLSTLPHGESTMVYVTPPADRTDTSTPQCIFGEPYAFQVIPGDADKLMFYWQGGGACWDAITTDAGMCMCMCVYVCVCVCICVCVCVCVCVYVIFACIRVAGEIYRARTSVYTLVYIRLQMWVCPNNMY